MKTFAVLVLLTISLIILMLDIYMPNKWLYVSLISLIPMFIAFLYLNRDKEQIKELLIRLRRLF